MRRAVVAVLVVAVGGAAGLWWCARRDEDVPAAPTPSAKREPKAPALVASPAPAGAAAAPTKAGAPPPPATDGAAAPALGFTVKGHVLGVTPVPSGALVVVIGTSPKGRSGGYLGRAAPAADGAFQIACAAPGAREPWSVSVRAMVPGHAEVAKHADVSSGATSEVDLSFEDEREMTGRVEGPDGRPLAIRMAALSGTGSRGSDVGALPDRDHDEGPAWRDTSFLGTVSSGPDGRFRFAGLREGDLVHFQSYDDAWWLDSGSDVAPPRDDGEYVVRAWPGFRAQVDVVPSDPADERDRWKAVGGVFELPFLSYGIGGSALPLVLRGRVPDEYAARGFTARVLVDTPEHRQERRTIEFAPGAWSQRIEIPLTRFPPDELGTVVVTVGAPGLVKRPGDLQLLQYRAMSERNQTGDWFWLERRDERTWTVRLHAGPRQHLELHAYSIPLASLVDWSGTVDVVAGRETPLAFPAVPVGRLSVRFPADVVGRDVVFSIEGRDPRRSASWNGKATSEPYAFPAVPAGAWSVHLQIGAESHTREVTVAADSPTTVEFP